MQAVRSVFFDLAFWSWTAIYVVALLPVAPFVSAATMRRLAVFWMRVVHGLLRVIVGIQHRIVGLERLPPGPVIIACKHQSAWETLVFPILRVECIVGLKYELTKIPIFGWYLQIADNIVIDRGGATKALRSLTKGAKKAVKEGLSVLIFPEGTRTEPGAPPDYKPGVAALYAACNVPCVPVALNSGLYWSRGSGGRKRPGTITLEILDSIPPGMPRKPFMAELEKRIETATDRLLCAS